MDRIVLEGIPVSNGVGMGSLCIFSQSLVDIETQSIETKDIEFEIARLERAIDRSMKQIYRMKLDLGQGLERQGELIFDVYKTILQDVFFIQEIKYLIAVRCMRAENAVYLCFQGYISQMDASGNEYVRQRIHDMNDICRRIINNMSGRSKSPFDKVFRKQIVVVSELTPSLAVSLARKKVMGVAACEGAAYFSHAAIILRGLGIPVINGIKAANVSAAGFAIIDGRSGVLILNPDESEIAEYKDILKRCLKNKKLLLKEKRKPPVTKDGRRISVSANIGSIYECNSAKEVNAEGIGLVRTEVLFSGTGRLPGEKTQFLTYSKIVKKMSKRPVVIRLVDFRGDKTGDIGLEHTGEGGLTHSTDRALSQTAGGALNCALNCALNHTAAAKITAGTTLDTVEGLMEKDERTTQIRSIVRAARYGNVGILIPMVNHPGEIWTVKDLVNSSVFRLSKEGKKKMKKISIGAVIETRDSVDNIDEILDETDFITLGTNDLFEQVMGKDRQSACLYGGEYFHPDFLRVIRHCIDRAKLKGRFVGVCGEMASDPAAAILLVGMGADGLSVTPSKVSYIKSAIRRIDLKEAGELAKIAIESANPDDVRYILQEFVNRVEVL